MIPSCTTESKTKVSNTHRKSIFEYPCFPSGHTTIQTVDEVLLKYNKLFKTFKSQKEMNLSTESENNHWISNEYSISTYVYFYWQPL